MDHWGSGAMGKWAGFAGSDIELHGVTRNMGLTGIVNKLLLCVLVVIWGKEMELLVQLQQEVAFQRARKRFWASFSKKIDKENELFDK